MLIAVSTAAVAGAQAAQASTNLLVNGGFDSIGVGAVPEGWGGLTYYTDGTHPGNVALPGWTVEAGSVRVKVAPSPGRDRTSSVPLWASAIPLEM